MSDKLPEGFVLDEGADLPSGFVLDEPPAAKPIASNFSEGLAFAKNTANQMFPIAFPLGETLAHFGSGAGAAPAAGLAGLAGAPQGLDRAVSNVEKTADALTYQPASAGGRALTRTLSLPMEMLARGADVAGDVANAPDEAVPRLSGTAARLGLDPMQTNARSPTERALEATTINLATQSLPALLLRGRSAEVGGDVARSSSLGRGSGVPQTPKGAPAAPERPAGLAEVPSRDALRDAASKAYRRADESGAVITAESFTKAKEGIAATLRKEGVDPTLHPDATAALKRIMEEEGPVSIQKLETLRKIAKDAEGSIKPADRRLAGEIVDAIDEFSESLTAKDMSAGTPEAAAALKEARNFYSRAKKAGELDELVRRAELSAPNFSASGMENALRTEFRALAKNERRMRLFTAEERAAIERVAKGGPVENVLRMLGKMAPTGVVSGALSSGAGFLTGGPVGAVALPATGAAARYAATRMTLQNAARANELMRRGPLGSPQLPSILHQEALINDALEAGKYGVLVPPE